MHAARRNQKPEEFDMYTFDYQRPGQRRRSGRALAAKATRKFLAGGQSLLPTMRLRLAQPRRSWT